MTAHSGTAHSGGASGLPFNDLERIYEALADAIDRTGREREAVMLARLVLLLAQDSADPERVLARIADAVTAATRDTALKEG